MSRKINRYHGVCQYRNCGKSFVANRRTAKYCNDDCRSLEHQLRKRETNKTTVVSDTDSLLRDLIERLEREFERVENENRALRVRIDRLEQRPIGIASQPVVAEASGGLDPKMIAELTKNTHKGIRLEN